MVSRVWEGLRMTFAAVWVLVLCAAGFVLMAVLCVVPFVVFDVLQRWAAS